SPNSPLFIFDKMKGYEAGYRVVTNLFATHRRIALALGLPLEARGIELVRAMRGKTSAGIKLLPPVEVETGPVKENLLTGADIDLFKFPTPKWNELDGGRYIGTGSMGIMRDPDGGWVNLGIYRVQIHDKSTATIVTVPGHDGEIIKRKYWDRGQSCPVVITCGQDPMLWCAAGWEAPWGLSEYDMAGWWRNKPVEVTRGVTTDLPIPATAEIAIEGEVVLPGGETRVEGPFGEWSGYYARGEVPEPVLRVTSILHRNNPIIQGNPPSRFNADWRMLRRAAMIWDELDRQVPGVVGVWMVEEASSFGMVVISLKQQYPGHAKQAALVAAGSRLGARATFVMVVDEDIDPSNTSELLWALGTRVDPETSIDVIGGRFGAAMFPMLPPEKRRRGDFEMSRAIILACKPYYWIKDFPPSIGMSPELAKKTKEKWKELFS
ncbi:UbiD family decarboxylase, partial [Chloroflexota bacterium]